MKINSNDTLPEVILEQMKEPRPLPMGRQEFEEWSDRIISGALLPPSERPELIRETQKAALAQMILHLGPTESHKPDAYFIHALRKGAVNEIAHSVWVELKSLSDARIAKQKEEAALQAERDILPQHDAEVEPTEAD